MNPQLEYHLRQYGGSHEPAVFTEPPSIQHQKLPFNKWPLYAKLLAEKYKPGDIGVGDVAERLLGKVGGTAFKAAFKAMFGKDCGCSVRRDAWNILYPLPVEKH